MADEPNVVELMLKVHAGLAKLIAPATPETLRATQPPPGSPIFGGMPRIIRWTIAAALVSLVGFLSTVPKPKEVNPSGPSPSPAAKTHGNATPAPASSASASPQPAATEKQS